MVLVRANCWTLFKFPENHYIWRFFTLQSSAKLFWLIICIYSYIFLVNFSELLLQFSCHQVVLEGLWQQGFMAIAAVGATNIGSIEVKCQCPLYPEP